MAENTRRRLLMEIRNPGSAQNLYEIDEVQHSFADGIGRVFSGPAVTKIEFFRIANMNLKPEEGPPVEEREVFLKLTLPTAVVLEAALNILSNTKQNMSLMDEATKTLHKLVEDGLERLKNA